MIRSKLVIGPRIKLAIAGYTKIGVIWDVSARKIDDETCEFTNTVHSSATRELMDFLGKTRNSVGSFSGCSEADFRGS
jgi:hypothetical protein